MFNAELDEILTTRELLLIETAVNTGTDGDPSALEHVSGY
jgi:hypothetical protein